MKAHQRFALAAAGRVWTRLGSMTLLERRKSLQIAQNPNRPLHALFGDILRGLMIHLVERNNSPL